MGDVLRLGVFLISLGDFGPMNEVFEETLPKPFPARTTVYVSLPPNLKLEIDAIAITQE